MSYETRRRIGWLVSSSLTAICLLFFLLAASLAHARASAPTDLLAKPSSRSMSNAAMTEDACETGAARGVPIPPATYYGSIRAGRGFTPTPGMALTAWIGDYGCGQAETLDIEGEVMYRIDVLAEGPGGAAGCGAPGRTVTFQVASQVMAPTAAWDNNRQQELALSPAVQVAFSGSPTDGVRPLLVTFANQSSGAFTSLLWSFGGGATGTLENPIHTYSTAGRFTVTLTVSGPGGVDSLSRSDYVTVYEPVVAEFSGVPTVGVVPLLVQFTNMSSGDYSNSLWHFGDRATSTLKHPMHLYTATGHYTVTLTANGSGGRDIAPKADYITVREPYRVHLPVVARSARAAGHRMWVYLPLIVRKR